MGERTRNLALERDALQQSLATIQEQWHVLDIEHREMRERFELARTAADADIGRLTAELRETERIFEGARRDSQDTLDRLSSEHATALAALTSSVADRDALLQEQEARYALSLQAAEGARTELREGFEATLADRHREIEHLQETLAAAIQELEVTKRREEALQAETDQVTRLHKKLEESRAESQRLFQQAGLAMFRCTRDGALTQANRACMSLVGRRTIDELRGAQFAAVVFDAPNNLSSLIDACLSTRAKESIETTWRRKDGGRLFVRLSARLSVSGLIEIVAEDLTRFRVLQERLGQALQMEAVGRLASEVAVTCGNLLNDVHQNGHEWLMTASGSTASRQRCEMLLDEVTRAAGFLRQLAAYGDEQARRPTLVDLNTVIRDLEPVLKRVAGDDVEVQLPDTSSSLNVDVGTERVERLLVNLASYGRVRMPFGGQLRIELGTIVVDRHFAAKHPNVRLGLHALITVTEIRRAARADGLLLLRDGTRPDRSPERVAHTPGIDFGALQSLVRECGGHLWLTVRPHGDMVAKIRLPLLTPSDQTHPSSLAARVGRARTTPLVQH
jgi:PAS domain-containing protein